MPPQSDKIEEAKQEAKDDPLKPIPYISKSRLTTWVTCNRDWFYTYMEGKRGGPTYYTARGNQVHEAYELYYENVRDEPHIAFDAKHLSPYLPGQETGHGRREAAQWADWIIPYGANFMAFEHRRRQAVIDHLGGPGPNFPWGEAVDLWLPYGIEAEGWIDYEYDGDWTVPFMGFADLICWSASVPEVEANHGLCIVDFKTGSVKEEQYRDEGIYLEGEFYSLIFEEILDEEITAVAGYYPKTDDVVVSPCPDEDRRAFIDREVNKMVDAAGTGDMEEFPMDQQPLCKWKPGEENQCDHYAYCDTAWGTKGGPGPSFNEKENPGASKPHKDVGGIYALKEDQ